jgi:hypothetical protein
MKYKIVRIYQDNQAPGRRIIKRGLTLEDAQHHCSDPETSSQTCKLARNIRRTELRGPWFDGYAEDK